MRDDFVPGHIVRMSLRHHDETLIDSVAECECGWTNLVSWPGHDDEQDTDVEAHWNEIEQSQKAGR